MRQAENAYSLVFFCAILSAIKDKQNGMILPSLFPAGEKIDPSESNLDLWDVYILRFVPDKKLIVYWWKDVWFMKDFFRLMVEGCFCYEQKEQML